MIPIPELNLGAVDATAYKQRTQKQFLAKVFYHDHFLEDIIAPQNYFLIGEKGTGKTAYATLLETSDHRGFKSRIQMLAGTDYQKFFFLRTNKYVQLSDYTEIWKNILLLLTAHHLGENEPQDIFNFLKFRQLRDAVNEYYQNAFSPEITYALEFVENSEISANLVSKHLKAGAKTTDSHKETTQAFQTNLHYIRRQFEDAIRSLKLPRNHILFIDGIDIRPRGISFETYIECLTGLAHAAWDLNNDFFANIKDSKGRIKIVLLVRPDIFVQLGYHNANAKARDNSVILNWQTTYQNYRTSRVFGLIDGIIGKQQNITAEGQAWDHYFPYTIPHLTFAERDDNPFIEFLRYSFYRPRDIISYLLTMKEYVCQYGGNRHAFSKKVFDACATSYSDYLLGEVRDYLLFYFSDVDFDELTGFFKYLQGHSHFSWNVFQSRYNAYVNTVDRDAITIKEIVQGPEKFLQLLYSLNVIGYTEKTDTGTTFIHYCFRDRTPVKLSPKVMVGVEYHTHAGLARALNVGGGK